MHFILSFIEMPLEHFHSLSSSKEPFRLTNDQLICLAIENQVPVKQILSISNDQKSKMLDHKQICCLISQHDQLRTIQQSMNQNQSNILLNTEQIFSLAKLSNITLEQMLRCNFEQNNVTPKIIE